MTTRQMLIQKGVNPNLPQYAVFWAMYAPTSSTNTGGNDEA